MIQRYQPAVHLHAAAGPAPSAPDVPPVYRVGDTVVHPSEGICTVEAFRAPGGVESRAYYALKPTAEKSSSTVYMPVARGNALLRRLLTRDDILALIRRAAACDDPWIEEPKLRKDAFARILSEGDYARIIRMIEALHEARERRTHEGKKPCAADEAILADAERLLHQEFSYVLHMSAAETVAFICAELARVRQA